MGLGHEGRPREEGRAQVVNAAEKLEHQLEEKVKKAVQTRAEKRKAFWWRTRRPRRLGVL